MSIGLEGVGVGASDWVLIENAPSRTGGESTIHLLDSDDATLCGVSRREGALKQRHAVRGHTGGNASICRECRREREPPETSTDGGVSAVESTPSNVRVSALLGDHVVIRTGNGGARVELSPVAALGLGAGLLTAGAVLSFGLLGTR